MNLQEREINQKKRLGNDYCNLGNFSNFGYIFENYIYLSTERKYREGKMCSLSSRNDDHSPKLGKEKRFLSLTLTDTAALVENGKNVFSISFENGKVNSVRKS